MEFDNKKEFLNLLIFELIAGLSYIPLAIISFLGIYKTEAMPWKDYQFALLITVIYLTLAILWYQIKHSYFFISAKNGVLDIKYYRKSPRMFPTRYKRIQVPIKNYAKYEIKEYWWGKKELYIYRRTKKGIVPYPPVYVSTLNKENLQKLKDLLRY